MNPVLTMSSTGPAIQQVFTPLLPISQTQTTSIAQSTTTDHSMLDFLARQRVISHIQKLKPIKKRPQAPILSEMCPHGMSWESEGEQLQRLEKRVAEKGIQRGCTRHVTKGGTNVIFVHLITII